MKHLKIPKGVTVTGRKAAISAAFVKAIIPDEVDLLLTENLILKFLMHTNNGEFCSYCGESKATELDHFRASVLDGKPTGYGTDPFNLVPSCGKCNQSKGSKHWEDWILGPAKLSPKTREVKNLDSIVQALKAFEKETNPKVSKLAIEGKEIDEYFAIRDQISELLILAQSKAKVIKENLEKQ